MEILFCDECGMRFSSEAAPDAAQPGGEQKKLCEACRAKQRAAKPSNRQLQPARARSERSIPAAQNAAGTHRPAVHSADTARLRGGQASDKSPVAIGAIVVVVLLAVGGSLLLKSDAPTDTASAPAQTPSTRAPSPVTPPSTNAPQQQPSPASTSSNSSVQAKNTAQAAEEAFTKLQRFDGLTPDDREGRIRRIEEFLIRHGQEIVASRARVMLSELKAPPPSTTTPEQAKIETLPTTPANTETQPQPPSEGWRVVVGPITFEDGQLNNWRPDSNGPLDVGVFEAHTCFRIRPGGDLKCRTYRPLNLDGAGLRVRFRYFARNMDYVELLWAQDQHRPRKHIEPLARDGWAEACFSAAEIGGKASKLGHIEIGGVAKSPDAFLLIDDVVVEKQ